MVASADSYDFSPVIDEFLSLRPFTGPHAAALQTQIRQRARELLSEADVRYMPVFKILDLIAGCVSLARAIDQEPQLRPNEARTLLRESLSATAPLVHQFHLDMALERARYAPMMLNPGNAASEREQLLRQRWAAMRSAHQAHESLPPVWMAMVERTVFNAIAAPEFANFRPRPLLQFFAELLATARTLQQRGASIHALSDALQPTAALWRRYALKQARYRQPPPTPPEFPTRVTLH